jgi:hypothetical protein
MMVRIFLIQLFFFLLLSNQSLAQTDPFSGSWQMEYIPTPGSSPIKFEIQIADPEKNVLYPAHIILQCDSFFAEYDLLLVKKNTRELGISRNKYPRVEKPFGLGKWTWLLNGTFDLSKDLKGAPVLTAIRLLSKEAIIPMPDTIGISDSNKTTALRLKDFLRNVELQLKKTSSIPWKSKDRDLIIEPALSPTYFGIKDTIYLPTRDGQVSFSGLKKKEKDVLTVTLNGQVVLDKISINKKVYQEDLLLSHDLNIVALFADEFGDALPSTSKLNLEFGNKKFNLDFANRKDSASTFIVVKLVCDPDESKARYFTENPGEEKTVAKDEKFIGSIISTSQQLTFAVWDEVINDGDSISIKINGNWLVQGCPVMNNPRFITVTLKPGPNDIIFMADNLGSIPPNTSALEIIDGKRRKYYAMETRPGEKNLVKIFYDTRQGVK